MEDTTETLTSASALHIYCMYSVTVQGRGRDTVILLIPIP